MLTCKCGSTKFRLLLLQAVYKAEDWEYNIPMTCFNDDCDCVFLFTATCKEYADYLRKYSDGRECLVKSHDGGS